MRVSELQAQLQRHALHESLVAEDTEAFGDLGDVGSLEAPAKGAGCLGCCRMKGRLRRLRLNMRRRRSAALRQLRQAEHLVREKLEQLAVVNRQEEQRWRAVVSQRDRHLQVHAHIINDHRRSRSRNIVLNDDEPCKPR